MKTIKVSLDFAPLKAQIEHMRKEFAKLPRTVVTEITARILLRNAVRVLAPNDKANVGKVEKYVLRLRRNKMRAKG